MRGLTNMSVIFDDASMKTAKDVLSKCNEGFDIQAEYLSRVATLNAYVNYMVDVKGANLTDTTAAVNKAMSKMIERYNCGSEKLINAVKKIVADKFRPILPMQALTHDLLSRFQDISVSFTTPEIRGAIESVIGPKVSTVKNDQTLGVGLGLTYIEKYITPAIETCFPEDFQKYIKQ